MTSRDPDAAFLALVTAHEDTLLRAARLLTGDWAQAEELLQDTLAWTLTAWPTLGADAAAPLRVRQRLLTAYLETAPDAPAAAGAEPAGEPAAAPAGEPVGSSGPEADRAGGPEAEQAGGSPADRAGGTSAGWIDETGADRAGATGAGWGDGTGADRARGASAEGVGGAEARPGGAAGAERGGRAGTACSGEEGAHPAAGDMTQRSEWFEDAGRERVNGSAASHPQPTLVESLRTLPAEERAVVVARYYLGLSTAEIGEVLGVEAEEVAATAARLLAVLRWGR